MFLLMIYKAIIWWLMRNNTEIALRLFCKFPQVADENVFIKKSQSSIWSNSNEYLFN